MKVVPSPNITAGEQGANTHPCWVLIGDHSVPGISIVFVGFEGVCHRSA